MITKLDVLEQLEKSLPRSQWPWIARALRTDPQIWAALQGELGPRVAALLKNCSSGCLLAAIGLLAAGDQNPLQTLQNGQIPASRSLAIETQVSEDAGTLWMARCTQQALDLLERSAAAENWEPLAAELDTVPTAVLGILLGLLAEPVDWIAFMLTRRQSERLIQALMCNPLPPEWQQQLLQAAVPAVPAQAWLVFLEGLATRLPELASSLANSITKSSKHVELAPADRLLLPAKALDRLLQNAAAYRLSGQPAQAVTLLAQGADALRRVMARWKAEQAATAQLAGNQEAGIEAWQQALQLAPECSEYLGSLALMLFQTGRIEEAQAALSEWTAPQPVASLSVRLVQAYLASQTGDLEQARQLVHKIAKDPNADQDTPGWLAAGRWQEFADVCLNLGLPHDAQAAAERAAAIRPVDASVAAVSARSLLALGKSREAVVQARLARWLQPDENRSARLLAECLEAAGRWQDALSARRELLMMLDTVPPTDWHSLANCALNAGDLEQALEVSRLVLSKDGNDGVAHTLLGQAHAAREDYAEAVEHLERATHLLPNHAAPWLALASLYQQLGQNNKALDTLRAGAHAAPDLYEIQLALGESYLQEHAPTQALAALRAAARLLDAAGEITAPADMLNRVELGLGQTLLQLGHLEEARNTLLRAYQANPENPAAALGYAQVLLALNDPNSALAPIRMALQSRPADRKACLAYARCVLDFGTGATSEDLADACRRLKDLIASDPEDAEANAYLAEILSAQGDYTGSLQTFQAVMETPLMQEMDWKVRLQIGLGRAALELGQVDAAIAALQEAAQADPLYPLTQRLLTEAYQAAHLPEDAYRAARTALALAPNDLDTLVWFAELICRLPEAAGASQAQLLREAVGVLHRATQLAPERTDLLVRLAELQRRTGEESAAQASLHRLLAAPEARSLDLYQAAQLLQAMGDAGGAVACLESALQLGGASQAALASPEAPRLVDLLTGLADARQQAGSLDQALEALNHALQIDDQNTGLYTRKAGLLLTQANDLESGTEEHQARLEQAAGAMEAAARIKPDDASVQLRAAVYQRAAGNLFQAMGHAAQALKGNPTSQEAQAASQLSADLARALLMPETARRLLQADSSPDEAIPPTLMAIRYCLEGELALDANDLEKATQALVSGLELAPELPRLLALQARLTARRLPGPADQAANIASWISSARELFQNAMESLDSTAASTPVWAHGGLPGADAAGLRSALAEAALELREWGAALNLAREAQVLAPQEPYAHWLAARVLTLRAEAQRLYQQLEAVRRSPGLPALSAAAWTEFQTAIQTAGDLLKRAFTMSKNYRREPAYQAEEMSARQMLERWSVRGQAAFQPSPEHAQALAGLSPDPEDTAAFIACLSHTGDLTMASAAGRQFPNHPLVLAQLALALAQDKPRQALAAAQASLDAAMRKSASAARKSQSSESNALLRPDDLPLLYALQARLYRNYGHRLGDQQIAGQAIQAALEIWPDEPRWHAMAAEIYLKIDDLQSISQTPKAISHLEQALHLEPNQAEHPRRLGEIHLQRGRPSEAIPVLERACQLSPEDPRPWMLLAHAHQARGDLQQADLRAERAGMLAPDWIEPLIVRSEVALAGGRLDEAQAHAQVALQLDPLQPNALMVLARSLQAAGQSDKALLTLSKALEQTGAPPLPLKMEQVRLLHAAQGLKPALEALETLAQANPNQAEVLALQAELLEQDEQSEAAVRAAQQALRAYSMTESPDQNQIFRLHNLAGRLLSSSGQLDQAIHHLSEAIRIRPESAEPYLELGRVHLERRQYPQAQRAFQQAIASAPADPRGYHQAGLAYKEARDYLEAERLLRKASDLAPKDVGIRRLLGAVVALNLVHNRRPSSQEIPASRG